jgi:hypothetical protein
MSKEAIDAKLKKIGELSKESSELALDLFHLLTTQPDATKKLMDLAGDLQSHLYSCKDLVARQIPQQMESGEDDLEPDGAQGARGKRDRPLAVSFPLGGEGDKLDDDLFR